MDVRCERCSTEYEFDDALVSGRGTTVKCTNCGHKFKIRRSDGDFSEDFWNVQTGDGRTLVFTSLRELQRAIQTNLVDRNDLLSRGGLRQKPIGHIPELAPFFEQRDAGVRVSGAPGAGTTEGSNASARPVRSSRPPPPPGATTAPLGAPARHRQQTRPDYPPSPEHGERLPASVPSTNKTLAGTGADPGQLAPQHAPAPHNQTAPLHQHHQPTPEPVYAAPAPAPTPAPAPVYVAPAPAAASQAPPPQGPGRLSEAPPTERDSEPDTRRFEREEEARHAAASAKPPSLTRTQPIDPVYLPKHTPPPPVFEASSPLPQPVMAAPVQQQQARVDEDYEIGARGHSPSMPDGYPDSPASLGRRRSVGGYIVAVVVIAGMGVIGAVWAKDHLRGFLGSTKAPVVVTDPRVAAFLASGEKALADGDLEIAKESFDKASALAEKDPRVLLDAARLAAARADVPWLKARLLAPDATDDIRLTKETLAERSAAARKAADDALAVAPEDPAALRAKIDSLRISGDRDGARTMVAKVAPSASQPETAYVLAALDLAENEPLWSSLLERLRTAASAESGPGRARAALVYALARSGDVAAARSEVDRLAAMPRQHALLPLLRAFADHAKPVAKVDDGLDAGVAGAALDSGKRGPRDRGEPGDRGDKGRLPGDARQLVTQGEAARARGDNERAQMLFAAALDRNPNDAEALNGLAAIAHSRHDLNGARASYKRVLSINPSYVPALVGVGDVDWESGDKGAAMKTYKEIVERFPEGSYPARVKQRAEGTSGGGSSSGGAAPAATPSAAPADTGGGG